MDDMLLAYLCCALLGGACLELITVASSTACEQGYDVITRSSEHLKHM